MKEKINLFKYLEMDVDGWTFRLLKTINDFKNEARLMHNCLYNYNWYEKVLKGNCLVFYCITPSGERIDFAVNYSMREIVDFPCCVYDRDKNISNKHELYIKNWFKRYWKGEQE